MTATETALGKGSRTASSARWAVTGLALRQTHRGAAVVIALTALMSVVAVGAYRSTVASPSDAAGLAALAENPAIRTLFGEPVALDDAGGFAVWRTGTVLSVLLAVWGLLAATRITRGEEDAGRWDVLLAGRVPVRSVVGRHLVTLVAWVLLAGVAAFTGLVAAGAAAGGAAAHATGLALCGVFFAALGTLTSQVFAARTPASGAAVAVLGVGMLLKMVGDGIADLEWLRWLSPFGMAALARPYDGDHVGPLAVLGAVCALLAVVATASAGRRDIRGGHLPSPSGRAPRRVLLGSAQAFAVRRLLRPLAAWSVGIGVYFLLIGVLAVSMTAFLTANPRFAELAAQAGFGGLATVEGYVAALFALLAVPVGAFVSVRLADLAQDESSRRLTLLLAQPVTRVRLLAAEATTAIGGAVVLTTVAGLATWAGARVVGAGLGLLAALSGAWNVLPVVVLCLGTGVLALAWAPRAVALAGCVPAVGGFLLEVFADTWGWPTWIGQASPFAHLAAVPDAPVGWLAAMVMTSVGILAALVGAVGYRRRDLRV
ncbi:ABC transporter permease [Streptomyces sp. NPDC085460]|uniref:ABC transporter permease n=1 Tax=Streptomyces sp. NPDC085460 TaxID=3365723 RepID=UPI0037D408E5